MTRPSVRVSVFRLVVVALLLGLVMNRVGHQIRKSIDNQQTVKVAEDWPTSLPNESLRVHSLDGLSIIRPSGWEASISDGSIHLVGPSTRPGYLTPSEIRVNRVTDPYRHPRPLPRSTLFQDGHACLKILHVRSTPQEAEWHEAHVIVKQNDEMYEIIFRSHKYFEKRVPDRIWNYLETFKKRETGSLTASLQ